MKETKDYASLLLKRKYDPNTPPPPENIVFVIDSKNIGTLQNFVTITGMQKSGKTTFMSAMIAAGLTNTEQLGMRIRLPENRRRVSFWDTEQGDYDFYKTMEKVRTFTQADRLPLHFDSYNLREDEPHDIIWMIKKYLELNKDCSLIVIDGILDLIDSYNDEAKSKHLINMLKQITKVNNMLALLTLHKGKTTSTTLGHLGSMADRAAQSVLLVEKIKERNTFVLKADYLRSADDFDPIEVYFNKDAHRWEQTMYIPEEDTKVRRMQPKPFEINIDVHRNNIGKIFLLKEVQQYKELVQNIGEFYAVGTSWARECVTYLMDRKLIFKSAFGYSDKAQAKFFIQ